MVAGFQVPVIPSIDLAGSDGAVSYWQSGPIGSKVTAISGLIITVTGLITEHPPVAVALI
jgi:hypothetical protein